MTERYHCGVLYPSWIRHEHYARYQFACDLVRGQKVVDAACGAGIGSSLFLKAGAQEVLAFDSSDDAIDEARRLHASDGLVFQSADCLRLPVADRSADVFISLETIEHLSDDRGFLEEVTRILRPGGVLIASTPNRDVTNPKTSISDKPMNPFHQREYSSDEWRSLLENHFSSVRMYGQNRQSRAAMGLILFLRRFLPAAAVVWVQRFFKLRWAIGDSIEKHRVVPADPDRADEILVSVCSLPKHGNKARL